MAQDDEHTPHNHGFELPEAPRLVVRDSPRRWAAVAGVAICLGLAGVVTGVVVAHRQKATDAHITSDALQREELRDGWKTLGAAAARDALSNNPPPSVNSAPPAPAQPSVVIVQMPAPAANPAQPVVNNITIPSASNGPALGATGMAPGYSNTQSMPMAKYSPAQGYAPALTGYVAQPTGSASAQPGALSPQNSYGTTTGNVAPGAAPVGNGSIPGSTPNPALPNNGLVGSTPTPGLPNGSVTGSPTPNTPVGTVPAAPSVPTAPATP